MNEEIVKLLFSQARRNSSVIVRRRDKKPADWDDIEKIRDYIRENQCFNSLRGEGISYFDRKGDKPLEIPEADFSFEGEQAATDFYYIMQNNEKYIAFIPESPVGLANFSLDSRLI